MSIMLNIDSGYSKKGTIALSVQDKVVYYDNIKVTGPQIPNTKLSPVNPTGKLTATWGEIKKEINR